MKNPLVDKILKIVSLALASFNAIMFFAMRPCWSGISKTLGYEKGYNPFILNLPVIVFVALLILFVLDLVFFLVLKKKSLWNFILLPINFIMTAAIVAIFALGAIDYARFIFFDLSNILGIIAVAMLLIALIFWYPKSKLKDRVPFKWICLGAIILGAGIAVTDFNINYISYEPVVYVVEDNYQIVFSSNSKSTGYVEINGQRYYDLYAGSEKSADRVHKVTVPQSVLDAAGSYSIHATRFLYRGPFGAITGPSCAKDYKFTPVKTSDGLNYYSLSDIHMDIKGAINAAKHDEGMELLVLNGDIISMVDTYFDANYVNKVAFSITKGQIPVIYARGNHEIKGKYSETLYKYVGSKNEEFYYPFSLDNGKVKGFVLDWGEDHDDSWWEYYGTAEFESYRKKQLDMLDESILSGGFGLADYKLVVCHIPLPFINARHNHVESKKAVVSRLNLLNPDLVLAGHQHDLFIFEPGQVEPEKSPMKWNDGYGGKNYKGYLLDFKFPSLMVSKHGFTQFDDPSLTQRNQMIGMQTVVDFSKKESVSTYNDVNGKKVPVVNPFSPKDYGEEVTINLLTKAMN